MKQARLYGPDDLRLDEVPKPSAGEHDVVVKVAAAGICGSDLHFLHLGGLGKPTLEPLPIGHEFAGVVDQVGAGVKGLVKGQRVVVNPMSGGNAIGTGAPTDGGFGEYVLVRNARVDEEIFAISDSLPFERAVLAEPIAVGMHGLNLAEVKPGCKAVVFGAGPIGLGAVAALRHRGAAGIVAVDIVDERLERARRLGATAVVNSRNTPDLRAALAEALGTVGGNPFGPEPLVDCDAFIDAAGVGALIVQAVDMAKPHASIVVIARHGQPMQMDLRSVMVKELSVKGSLCYPTEFKDVLAMLSADPSKLDPMVSHTFALADVNAAFQQAKDPVSAAKVVLRVD